MKVVSSQQMAKIEELAYRAGASDSDFMEEAGSGVALVINDLVEKYHYEGRITLLCGKGNNAGDAYVAGVHLLNLDYEVVAYQLFSIDDSSPLCRQNYLLFIQAGGRVKEVSSSKEVSFPEKGIIIDGIFGTGFKGQVQEPVASIIKAANKSDLPILAIDIPSGLQGDTGIVEGEAIIAHTTAFLGLPKTGFFLNDGWNHVGKLAYVDFGLPKEYIESAEPDLLMLSPDLLHPLMPPLVRNRHKYEAGHVVGLAGSPNMTGAAMLASLSCLSGGAGIIHLLYSEGMEGELTASPYEVIKVPYQASQPNKVIDLMNKADALFIGPGLGVNETTRDLLSHLLPNIEKPCVIDADALTILAETKISLPKETIFTPHHGELKRLLRSNTSLTLNMKLLEQCQKFAEKRGVTLILKGGPSFIFHPGQPIYVCSKGDPGMATAGSGDVLTGLLAALLAQKLSTHHAALLGVYLHGVAGEFAADNLTSYCMTASDLIAYFPDAFQPYKWTE